MKTQTLQNWISYIDKLWMGKLKKLETLLNKKKMITNNKNNKK